MLEQGYSESQVGRMLGCGHSAVSKWRKAYEKGGMKGIQAIPDPGRKRRLSMNDLPKLAQYLKAGPIAARFETDLWTCRRVAELIRHKFGVEYHHCHVWKILQSLGWTCQKPERCARQRDEDAILTWRQQRWPAKRNWFLPFPGGYLRGGKVATSI